MAADCFPPHVSTPTTNLTSSIEELSLVAQLSFLDDGNDSLTLEEGWETRSPLPAEADVCLAAFLIFIEIMAVTFNLFVIVVSLKNFKSLHPSDAFVVFLACSDLGHPLLGYPFCIVAALQHGWTFGYIGCQVHGFLGFMFGVASMTCLACMSVSRFVSVAMPNFGRTHGGKLAAALLTFTFLNAVFWAACPLLGWGRYDLEPYKTSCTLQWDYPDISYVTACFVGCLAVPFLLMTISYGHITRLALATGRRRRQWALKNSQQKVHEAWSTQEMRLFKLTITMCSVFVLAWVPYSIFAMLTAYTQTLHVPLALTPLAAITAKCSHVLDPIIYCALNNKFRRFFPQLKRRRKVRSEKRQEGDVTTSVPLNNVNISGGDELETQFSQELSDTN